MFAKLLNSQGAFYFLLFIKEGLRAEELPEQRLSVGNFVVHRFILLFYPVDDFIRKNFFFVNSGIN